MPANYIDVVLSHFPCQWQRWGPGHLAASDVIVRDDAGFSQSETGVRDSDQWQASSVTTRTWRRRLLTTSEVSEPENYNGDWRRRGPLQGSANPADPPMLGWQKATCHEEGINWIYTQLEMFVCKMIIPASPQDNMKRIFKRFKTKRKLLN